MSLRKVLIARRCKTVATLRINGMCSNSVFYEVTYCVTAILGVAPKMLGFPPVLEEFLVYINPTESSFYTAFSCPSRYGQIKKIES
jgi:hypothetical protein